MFGSLVDIFSPFFWADGAIHIHLNYLAPFFTQPTDDEKFTLLRILISQWTLVTCVTLIR